LPAQRVDEGANAQIIRSLGHEHAVCIVAQVVDKVRREGAEDGGFDAEGGEYGVPGGELEA
jgi:hypothetical protein